MDGPLVRASGKEAVRCQIGTLTDSHASVADQEDISAQVVAEKELLLRRLIVFGPKRTRSHSCGVCERR